MENSDREIIEKLSDNLQRARLGEYVELMQNPIRLIILNFAAGIFRGLGIAAGFTIISALLFYMLQKVLLLNIPIIGGVLSEIVKLVKMNVR